jgi:hypothetical protein
VTALLATDPPTLPPRPSKAAAKVFKRATVVTTPVNVLMAASSYVA